MHEIGIVCFMSSERLARMHMSKCYMFGSMRKVGLFVWQKGGMRFELLDGDTGSHDEEAPATSLPRDRTPQDRRRPGYSVASGANSQKPAQNGTPWLTFTSITSMMYTLFSIHCRMPVEPRPAVGRLAVAGACR